MYCLASLDGGLLASGWDDGNIKVWSIATWKCVTTIAAHASEVLALANLDGGLLTSGAEDDNVKVWNVATGQCVMTIKGFTHGVEALAQLDGGLLASGSSDEVKVWDALNLNAPCSSI